MVYLKVRLTLQIYGLQFIDAIIGIIKVILFLISGCNLKSVNQLFYGPKVETVGFCSNAPAGPKRSPIQDCREGKDK